MPLTEEQIQLRNQAIAGKNQRFLQDLERLSADMSAVFEKMNSIGLYVSINPEILALTNEDLAQLGKHYDALKLQAALSTLAEIKTAAAAQNWTAKVLGIY